MLAKPQNDLFHFLTILESMGEVFGKISEESKKYFSNEDLIGIRGIRNRIVHDYTGIYSFRIFEIIRNNIPSLKSQITEIISIYLENGIIDLKEYLIAKNSKFYKHINFI